MSFYLLRSVLFPVLMLHRCSGISSPIQTFVSYNHSVELQANIADLWWTVDDVKHEIMFELHVKTTGWIALGVSPGQQFVFVG